MKKLFIILLCISAIIMPNTVYAKSFSFAGYKCDSKVRNDDGTFTMTCHIVAKTDFEINHIQGNLILKNVTLKEIKTQNDWTSNNGLSSTVDFTSTTNHEGSFAVADLTFTGNLSDVECEASFEPVIAEYVKPQEPTPQEPTPEEPTIPTCAIVDDEYYDKNGYKVTEEKYYEDCFNYSCTVVANKYYFNSEGKSVSYDKYVEDCSGTQYIPESPETGIDMGLIALPIGILTMIGIVKLSKKNTKIYKI